MALPYWTQEDLENRVSVETVRQVLDDDNDGSADAGPIARLQADSDSFVEGYLRAVYSLDACRDVKPNQIVRLSLDYAVAQLAKRHPEYIQRDWMRLEESVRNELCDIRGGKVRLDIETSPEPTALAGADVFGGGVSLDEAPQKFFVGDKGSDGDGGGMGDF